MHQTHFEKIYTIFVCKSSAKNLVYDGAFVGVNERRSEEYLHVNGNNKANSKNVFVKNKFFKISYFSQIFLLFLENQTSICHNNVIISYLLIQTGDLDRWRMKMPKVNANKKEFIAFIDRMKTKVMDS